MRHIVKEETAGRAMATYKLVKLLHSLRIRHNIEKISVNKMAGRLNTYLLEVFIKP